MKTETIIYSSILVILLLGSLSLLALYYTQDFSSEINFNNIIRVEDVEFQTYSVGNTTYLSEANTKIGELLLENNGYFTRVYAPSTIYACLNVKNSVDATMKNNIERLVPATVTYNKNIRSYSRDKIKIPTGEKASHILDARINLGRSNIPADFFAEGNIESISVYVIKQKEANPLGFDYNNRYYYGYNGCGSLANEREVAKVIPII